MLHYRYYSELNVKQQNLVLLFYFVNITVTEIDLDNAKTLGRNTDYGFNCMTSSHIIIMSSSHILLPIFSDYAVNDHNSYHTNMTCGNRYW